MWDRLTLDGLLESALSKKASDIHLSIGTPIALRIDGQLCFDDGGEGLKAQRMEQFLSELLSPAQRNFLEKARELDFSFSRSLGEREVRCRGNCFFALGCATAVLRIIPERIPSPSELGLPMAMLGICQKRRGLFLVTGPAGSGKTTTLASLIQEINRTRRGHIITVEDPVEYLHKSCLSLIHQREVGQDTKDFGGALRQVLRQDPDVILIGEMRDSETIAAALTAAETGHLVFSTLHTQDAAQTMDRIVDVFEPSKQGQIRAQLSETLLGLCCQQLVPMKKGGRCLATELLFAFPSVRSSLREGKTGQIRTILQTGRAQGMHTMEQSLCELVCSGTVEPKLARSFAADGQDFDRLISQSFGQGGGAPIVALPSQGG